MGSPRHRKMSAQRVKANLRKHNHEDAPKIRITDLWEVAISMHFGGGTFRVSPWMEGQVLCSGCLGDSSEGG